MGHKLYILSVFFHIVAACLWLGGMLFLILAFIPGIKKHPDKVNIIANVSLQYRKVGIVALIILLITGLFQLECRGVQWNITFFTSTKYGQLAGLKVLVFTGILLISFIHDYFLGNRAIEAWKNNPEHSDTIRLRSRSRLLGRVSFTLAALAVLLGVMLSRGW